MYKMKDFDEDYERYYRKNFGPRDDFDILLDEGDADDDGILDEEDDDFVPDPTAETNMASVDNAVSEVGSGTKSFSKKKIVKNEITPITTTGSSPLEALASAIQNYEGWSAPGLNLPRGSTSFRNRNPGNLKNVGQAGAIGTDPKGFAIFSSYDAGRQALLRDLGAKLARKPDHTIFSLITEYEGGDPANPVGNDVAYANGVARWLSEATGKTITSNTKIYAI